MQLKKTFTQPYQLELDLRRKRPQVSFVRGYAVPTKRLNTPAGHRHFQVTLSCHEPIRGKTTHIVIGVCIEVIGLPTSDLWQAAAIKEALARMRDCLQASNDTEPLFKDQKSPNNR